MADVSLQARSALHGVARKGLIGRRTGAAGVTVREITGFAALTVIARKGRTEDVATLLSKLVGAPVPDAARRCSIDTVAVTGTGPGQWLVIDRSARIDGALAVLRRDLDGLAAVADQGDGRLLLEISGPNARDALAKGIAVDLDPVVFKIGDAAATMTAHIGVQVALIDAQPTFELVSAASTGASLWSWLVASAAEFGMDVV